MSRVRALAQLVRLPNLPTPLADIGLGVIATAAAGLSPCWSVVTLVALASVCLYAAGMVFNDYFDVEQDRRERPFRPIPSGALTRRQAGQFGMALMAVGVVFAALTSLLLAGREARVPYAPSGIALGLVVAILLYDAQLKRTWLGPVGMGVCRFLNVLLGVCATGTGPGVQGLHLAAVVGLYIAGVTWFARTEARASRQSDLAGAAGAMLAALALALPLPALRLPGQTTSPLFVYLLVALGFVVGLPTCQAIALPTPARVQAAVKRALQGLVLLDAVLATALAGNLGLVLVLLLVPTLYLSRSRWLYAT